jgi:hypothetical protein
LHMGGDFIGELVGKRRLSMTIRVTLEITSSAKRVEEIFENTALRQYTAVPAFRPL